MRTKIGILLLTVMGLILIYPNAAHGQAVNNAQIHGTVTDQTGAVVPNASIQATHVATGKVRTTVTGSSGDYVLTNLSVGAYSIEVKASGFERYVQTGIVLQVGDNVDLGVTLKVGAVSQSVEVNAGATMVQTQDTSISEVIDQRRIDDLPLNGRLPTQLVILSGAATNFVPNGGDLTGSKNYLNSVTISVAGGEANGIEYLLDGADHDDPFSNVNLPLPPPDALQEFSVQTNGLSARYGVHPGATANFVTKAGTNAFHGDLFEFVRNGQFNARLYGAAAEDTLRRNQFGGTAGGAIKKDKLFYFGGYQGTRLRTAPGTTTSYVPTAAAIQGDFSALESHACVAAAPAGQYRQLWDPFTGGPKFGTGTKAGAVYSTTPPPPIPLTMLNQAALNYVKLVPSSTDSCGKIQYGIPTPQNEDQFLGRVDWTISSKQSFYGRYFDSDLKAPPVYNPAPAGLGLLTTTTAGNWERVQAMVLGHTWSLSPTTINSAHLSWTRLRDNRGTDPGVPDVTSVGVINPDGTKLPQLSPNFIYVSASNYFSSGCGTCAPAFFNRNTVQAADDVDWIHGKHQLVLGGEWMRHQLNSSNIYDGNGTFAFNGTYTNDALAD
ncbi:MAG: carboxypeptidase-like regulatory domain-containing protein, partial [Terriglobia bacterium]